MELQKFTIGKKSMDFSAMVNFINNDDKESKEVRKVSAFEEPLPSLAKAYAALSQVMAAALNIPDHESYADRINVHGLTISHTKHGTRSVMLRGKLQLDSRKDYLHPIMSPMLQIDDPADGESGEIQVADPKHLKAIKKAIVESMGYADGSQRSQTLLDFAKGKAALQATADIGGKDMFSGTEG